MDGRTVRRAEKFAKGVDALREVNPEAADKVLNGKAKVTKADIQEIGTSDQKDVEVSLSSVLAKTWRRRVDTKWSAIS